MAWGADSEIAGDPYALEVAATGCKFIDRCPFAFEPCAVDRPPLYREHPSRAAACYLYSEAPVVEQDNLNDLFALDSAPEPEGNPAC